MPRLFIAIDLPDFAMNALAELREELPGFSWAPKRNLHLTLKFIGDVDEDMQPRICDALDGVRVKSFLIELEGIGCFPPERRQPKVVWAGLGKAHPNLFALHKHVDDALFAIGIAPDARVYEPHITLARTPTAKRGAVEQFLKKHRDFGTPPFRIEGFRLYRSQLDPAGAIHTPVAEYALG